jgi:chemotaxis protein CheZ
MSNDTDDLDALFDSIAAQREQVQGGVAAAPAATARPAEQGVSEPAAVQTQPAEPGLPPASAIEAQLYSRLGAIVRELHDALRELGHERPLFDAVHEVFDSQERLKYIASLTEQAANKVLNAVDASLPVQDSQGERATELTQRWQAMFEGKLGIDEFKQLAADSRDFCSTVAANSDGEKARLMDIMMAQDFQDITGQIIKKVLALTGNLETQLMQLLRDYAPSGPRNAAVDLLSGPNVPTAALGQGDVDSLLAELGF